MIVMITRTAMLVAVAILLIVAGIMLVMRWW